MTDCQELILLIAKYLVNNPDDVAVRMIEGATATIFELRVATEDKGRVIGKAGRTANAIRTLLRAIAAKDGKRVTLEIV